MQDKKIENRKPLLGWEVVLFLALYAIMPSYCAIELHEKLPLITASRAVLVLMGIGLLLRRRSELLNFKNFSLKNWNLLLTENKLLRFGLFGYFIILMIVNATFLTETSEAIKQMFVIVAEEYALVWMLALTLDSREKIVAALKVMALSSAVVAVVACIGCAISFNPFSLLNTVSRDMLMSNYYRLGMLRAVAGFGHPVYYGAFCTVMFPLCMYLVDEGKTKKERILYGVCLALNFSGLVLSNSRGSMLALGCLGVLVIVIRFAAKSLKKLFTTYLPYGALALAILVLVASFSPLGIQFLSRTMSSLVVNPVETVATEPTVTEPTATEPTVTEPSVTEPPVTEPSVTQPAATEPSATEPTVTEPPAPTEPPVDYGENKNGLDSRLDQLTGIRWTLTQEPIFGFGPNCHVRGLMAYMYYPGHWSHVESFDVNIVAIIGQYGLVGLVAFLLQYGCVGITLVRRKYRGDKLMHYLLLAFIAYMLCLLSIANLDKTSWILIGILISLVNIMRKEKPDTRP